VSLSLPHHSIIVMWHDDGLTYGKFKKKIKKSIKIKKIQELTRDTPLTVLLYHERDQIETERKGPNN